MNLLGKKHPSKPQTSEDRAMSERHLATRAKVDDMKATPDTLRKSISYNAAHAKEHLKAVEDRRKDLAKAQKDRSKLVDKMAKARSK